MWIVFPLLKSLFYAPPHPRHDPKRGGEVINHKLTIMKMTA
jgi:hypothetical protein